MKIALIGLPQAGKKSLFTLLTGRRVPESRKPGETLEGVAPIRDARVDTLNGICKPQKKTYAENHFMLCPDVATGTTTREWLDAGRRCDLICLVVRSFASDAVYHPAGSVDAGRDVDNLKTELLLADMEIVDKRLARIAKEKRNVRSAAQDLEEHTLRKCMQALEESRRLADVAIEPHELASIRSLDLITLIPVMPVYNVSEDDIGSPSPAGSVAVSCRIEEEIMALTDPAERQSYLESLGLKESGLDRVNAAAYAALGLMSFYTIGKDEVRAWTIRCGSVAPVAAGKIHSDIERGFIRAECMKFDDFVAAGSEKAAREAGKVQAKGKDYVIEDGDICHFLFSV